MIENKKNAPNWSVNKRQKYIGSKPNDFKHSKIVYIDYKGL